MGSTGCHPPASVPVWRFVASPQQRTDDGWYLGTADAVYQNIYSLEESGADALLVLAADHVYKMDYRQMLAFHRGHGGVATVAALHSPVGAAAGQFASPFGIAVSPTGAIVVADTFNHRVEVFR